jgi:outer membrane protein OmpA-like peptidoglycan-associated protein
MSNSDNHGADPNAVSFAAQHAVYPRTPLKVAPTDGNETFNAIRFPLIPQACWRLGDRGFAFDSSFISPDFRNELSVLSGKVRENAGCVSAVFAHADPVGSDAVNKTLTDRRAMAVYGLLTRQKALWAWLYDNPQVGDAWGVPAIQMMLASLTGRATDDAGGSYDDPASTPYYAGAIDGETGPTTMGAIRAFQRDAGKSPTGRADADTRSTLFGAYMNWLCTPDGATAPFKMAPTDFLGGAGLEANAVPQLPRLSLQGCGKLNPVVLLPSREMNQEDTMSRNADDAPNRRVIMYFFPPGTRIDPGSWPCPSVKDEGDACTEAFWPGGDARRQNGKERRNYKDTRDTMACRFYDRFARRSPCEGAAPVVRIRLFNTMGEPMPGAIYRLKIGAKEWRGTATATATVTLVGVSVPVVVSAEWGPPPTDEDSPDDGGRLIHSMTVTVLDPPAAIPATLTEQLHALGYPREAPLRECVRKFQDDYGLARTSDIHDPNTNDKARELYLALSPRVKQPPASIYTSLFDELE